MTTIVRVEHILWVTLLSAGPALHAQSGPSSPPPTVPTVTFTLEWPSREPHRYLIAVDSGGSAVYRSWTTDPEGEASSADDPYLRKFALQAATRDRIFALARQLNYFNGDFEYHKHRVAFTGDKTLAYSDPEKRYETRYNWSENAGISELTTLFEGISTTIESGRRLERLYRFDRLGLDEELKNLERLTTEHQATELQLIAPILERLASDAGVLNIARQRARHLLQMAGAPSAGDNQPAHQ